MRKVLLICAKMVLGVMGLSMMVGAHELKLDDAAIVENLQDKQVAGNDWAQKFFAGGKTWYESARGREWGSWRVQNNQYCSQWPPSDSWNCYDLFRNDHNGEETMLIWIDAIGNRTFGAVQ
ncbi:MAG: hypothetical protein AAF352_09600 [Pseudomonadota bacterium]